MTPTAIIAQFNLTEAGDDPRWAGTPKHVWRGSRAGHGKLYADPTGDWAFYDGRLKAGVWDRHNPTRPGWQYIEAWIDGPYRVVWVDFSNWATFTYCEGDLTLVICENKDTFDAEILDAEKYYGPMAPGSA